MNQLLSCAKGSRAAGENPIGTASTHRVYVLVEVPTPWKSTALESPGIPPGLQELDNKLYNAGLSVRFLLIYNARLALPQKRRVLIFQRQEEWSQGYEKREYLVDNLETVPSLVEADLADQPTPVQPLQNPSRDLCICTHGSHDQCCARYGKPFYYGATKLVETLSLSGGRVWETSHFGGHRHAPTVIDFPSGRYYGKIETSAIATILQERGSWDMFEQMYRGWGILPETAQVLEQELIRRWGWDWFKNQVWFPVLIDEASATEQLITLWFKQPGGLIGGYQAQVVQDPNQGIAIRGECSTAKVSTFRQWRVKNIRSLSPQEVEAEQFASPHEEYLYK